ncbi:Subtilisin-like protease SDD1 [Platanthera zijinensis]|uniref:Subtilisin-like protease SDD1 n=1 Tax=Platanthera zijinensis TaxID=2320716 RepID=A0AAP0G4U9_9ASPA
MKLHYSVAIVFFVSGQLLLLLHYLPTTSAQLLPIVHDHADDMQIYIIDVERHQHHDLLSDEDLESWHASFLPNSTLDSGAPRLLYSYRHVLSGFSARLTPGELETIKSKPGFVAAQPSQRHHVETTYTPGYLGVTGKNGWGATMMGEGIIIGVIDTGVKPTHPSFDDSMIPSTPPKSRWKGNCTYKGFPCNKKIIGAKALQYGGRTSPLDTEGHGTHVASIAAGSFVKNANVLGTASGVASGMAPMAHLSIYKVCFPNEGCHSPDIYAAIEQAIKDGVDVINMSIGGKFNATFYEDAVSRGSMAAIQNNIIPVASAGNYGADPITLCHSAPWVLAVGASTTDRRIVSIVELGDGRTFLGESAYQPTTWNSSTLFPLEYPGSNGNVNSRGCAAGEMAKLNLKGKIVICEPELVDNAKMGEAIYKAGAEGMIVLGFSTQGYTTDSFPDVLPTSSVNFKARMAILYYYHTNKPNATAAIRFDGTQFGHMPSPAVAYFSSRGPSRMNGGLIKPDVLAPGVNILAAWPKDVGPNPSPLATHTFNFNSGTSMAAPHVSGIAALVRKKHLGWTPSEIISAIITTANNSWTARSPDDIIIDEISNDTAGIFTTGAGMVNPVKALDPGLVFKITVDSYIGYLCGLGYTYSEVFQMVGQKKNCSGVIHLNSTDLNYPSIAVNLTRTVTSQKVTRTAKNVGNAREEYIPKIVQPAGVDIFLSPNRLKFTRMDQEISYEMRFDMRGSYPSQGSDMIRRGKIVWDSGKHVVTTPIALTFA